MTQIVQMIVAGVALAGVVGSLMGVWWKVSSDNKIIKRDLLEHDRQIVILTTTKAEAADLIKLTELVAKIEQSLAGHALDTYKHRTHDFEARLENWFKAVEQWANENRSEHTEIKQMIKDSK